MKNFDAAFATFLAGCEKIYNDYMDANFPTNPRAEFAFSKGRKNIKVFKVEKDSNGKIYSRSVHCFVDMTNGDVLKAASWKAPAKHARGNIFKDDNGLGGVTAYGAKYL